jgi:hypothetical protein
MSPDFGQREPQIRLGHVEDYMQVRLLAETTQGEGEHPSRLVVPTRDSQCSSVPGHIRKVAFVDSAIKEVRSSETPMTLPEPDHSGKEAHEISVDFS